jgi:hypothetical protein
MRTLLGTLAAVVRAAAQQSHQGAVANARRAATEASTQRIEREEVALFLQQRAEQGSPTQGRRDPGSAPAIVVAR